MEIMVCVWGGGARALNYELVNFFVAQAWGLFCYAYKNPCVSLIMRDPQKEIKFILKVVSNKNPP